MPYIIYADIEFLIKKIDGCASNPENVSTTKIGKRTSCRYSISTILAYNHIEKKHIILLKRLCEKFCESLTEHAKYIIDLEMKKCYH